MDTGLKATLAEELLNNQLLQTIFEEMKQKYISEWESTSLTDSELREQVWAKYQAMTEFETYLHSKINDMKLKTFFEEEIS